MGNSCCCCAGKREDVNLGAPLKKRRCTDIVCFMVFFAFWAGMIALAVYCLVEGDIRRLFYGYDDYGNVCGIDNSVLSHNLTNKYANLNLTDRPYMFFTNYLNPFKSYAICVKECPDREMKNMSDVARFAYETGSYLCDYSVPLSRYQSTTTQSVSCAIMESTLGGISALKGCLGPCPAFKLPAEKPFIHRCIPSMSIIAKAAEDAVLTFTKFLRRYEFFYQFGMDFFVLKWELFGCAGIALGLGLLMVFMMRFVIKVMVWFIVSLACLAAAGGTTALWVVYARLVMGIDTQQKHILPVVSIAVDARSAFLAYSIIATVLTVVLLLIVLVMRKRLALAVSLFQEAGKCLETMPYLLVQPLWPYIWNVCVVAYAILVFVFLSGVSVPTETQDADNRTVVRYEELSIVTYFWWYHLFGVLWMLIFTGAVQQLVIAGAVSEWYFTRDKKTLSCPVISSTGRTIAYHLGSAAIGSFLIAILKLPRYILVWLDKKCKASENECARFTLKCCICCLWCLEKCMKFINRNAYIVIAITSTDFCHARVKAFKTLAENMLRVVAINGVGDFVLFLGKIVVTAGNVGIAVALFERHNADKPDGEKQLYLLPLAAVALFTYIVADGFLSVYEMLVDTLLLCFCEDEATNDGSPEKPYFMSASLRDFVNASSQRLNTLSGRAEPSGAEKKPKEAGDAESSRALLQGSSAAEANIHMQPLPTAKEVV